MPTSPPTYPQLRTRPSHRNHRTLEHQTRNHPETTPGLPCHPPTPPLTLPETPTHDPTQLTPITQFLHTDTPAPTHTTQAPRPTQNLPLLKKHRTHQLQPSTQHITRTQSADLQPLPNDHTISSHNKILHLTYRPRPGDYITLSKLPNPAAILAWLRQQRNPTLSIQLTTSDIHSPHIQGDGLCGWRTAYVLYHLYHQNNTTVTPTTLFLDPNLQKPTELRDFLQWLQQRHTFLTAMHQQPHHPNRLIEDTHALAYLTQNLLHQLSNPNNIPTFFPRDPTPNPDGTTNPSMWLEQSQIDLLIHDIPHAQYALDTSPTAKRRTYQLTHSSQHPRQGAQFTPLELHHILQGHLTAAYSNNHHYPLNTPKHTHLLDNTLQTLSTTLYNALRP
eukprot:gene31064-41376_t